MKLSSILLYLRRNIGLYNLSYALNPLYDVFTGGKRRPAFFDIDEVYPSLRVLDRAYEDIRSELEFVLSQQAQLPRYHDLDTNLLHSSGRYHRDKRWNVFMLFCYNSLPEHNRALCPKTCAALAQVPHLNQAFFSILDPGKSIPAHTGPTRAYIRYHLALRVPKNQPPHIRVADQVYTWKEGESMLFDDSLEHEIVNHADSVRAILIVDVMRPFPQPIFAMNLLLRKFGEWFYGPGVIEKAGNFRLQPASAEPSVLARQG